MDSLKRYAITMTVAASRQLAARVHFGILGEVVVATTAVAVAAVGIIDRLPVLELVAEPFVLEPYVSFITTPSVRCLVAFL
jgi:hypothetical protein